MFNKTLSAILRGGWLIQEEFAISHLPMVLSLLNGKTSGQEYMKGSGEFEMPFIIQENGKRINAYKYSENGLVLNQDAFTEKYIAVVPFVGAVTKYNGECGEPGLIKRQGWITELTANKNAVGYISLIDSPGGQADGTPQTANFIKNLTIPTAALIVGGAYSAGAWIASAHDAIFAADEYCGFGSIGAYTSVVDFSEYFKKQGINVLSLYPNVSRDKNLSYRNAIAGDTKLMLDEIGDLAQSFIDEFELNRGTKLKSKDWNTGKTFGAKQSIEIGLIDGIKPIMELVAELFYTDKNTFSNNQNSNMKLPKIEALAGVENPTEEQLTEANAELTTLGITNVALVQESVINEAAALTTERDSLKTTNETLTADLATANTAKETAEESLATESSLLATANAEIETLKAKIAAGPGATHKPAGGEDELVETDDEKSVQSQLDALPHNQAADKFFS